MKTFITKQGASNYYLVDEGMGGFLNPPQHAEHFYSIREERGGHVVGSYSLTGALESDYLPNAVKSAAQKTLAKYPGVVTEDWIKSAYAYFRHSYSPNGENRKVSDAVYYGKFWDNADQEQHADPRHHLAYLFVKEFDPTHEPRLDFIKNPPKRGIAR